MIIICSWSELGRGVRLCFVLCAGSSVKACELLFEELELPELLLPLKDDRGVD